MGVATEEEIDTATEPGERDRDPKWGDPWLPREDPSRRIDRGLPGEPDTDRPRREGDTDLTEP
jgi:hypothetical protein